ncbi:hypothetical protein G3M48_000499 [Beauveria asiatica]|uniref:Uncharacterized protein n=1 Tax=Beauveria asiatica TaxID=1069075 RepID=A0AAW0SAN2_9HYPO
MPLTCFGLPWCAHSKSSDSSDSRVPASKPNKNAAKSRAVEKSLPPPLLMVQSSTTTCAPGPSGTSLPPRRTKSGTVRSAPTWGSRKGPLYINFFNLINKGNLNLNLENLNKGRDKAIERKEELSSKRART